MMVSLPVLWWRTARLLCVAAAVLVLPACQQRRLEQLEAAQQQQARELAQLQQTLAERDEEVAELENCVDDLEGAVYAESDSTALEEAVPVMRL